MYDKIVQLKFVAADGKYYATDCANTETMFRIIQSIPSPKVEPLKQWLARVGYERIEEIENPELSMERMQAVYEKKGYPKEWIDKRMCGIDTMAYGAGRYDPQYEEKGIDYPFSYVRWTEQRNFEAFLGLVAEGRVTPKALVTHHFDFDNALQAYELLEGKIKEKYLGIVLRYPVSQGQGAGGKGQEKSIQLKSVALSSDGICYGLVGAGNFAKAVILPILDGVVKSRQLLRCCR